MSKKSSSRSSTVFKRIPAIKDRETRIELGRAHLLVALLAFALFFVLATELVPGFTPNVTLVEIAGALLVLVGLFSLAVVVRLYTFRK